MKTPEIRIYFSWLLYDTVSVELHKALSTGKELISKEEAGECTADYREAWSAHEGKILPALVELMGMEFYRDVIDVPCAPWFRAVSAPLTMNFRYEPDQFVDVLTHELCHVLLNDNTIYSNKSSQKDLHLGVRWQKLFNDDSNFMITNHIPVHALSKYIYLDMLKEPERLVRDIEHVQHNAPYMAAWDYVNEHGYMQIIEQLKDDYQAIKKELAE